MLLRMRGGRVVCRCPLLLSDSSYHAAVKVHKRHIVTVSSGHVRHRRRLNPAEAWVHCELQQFEKTHTASTC